MGRAGVDRVPWRAVPVARRGKLKCISRSRACCTRTVPYFCVRVGRNRLNLQKLGFEVTGKGVHQARENMRVLRAELLRQFARAPLNEVRVLDLRRCGVVHIGTDLGECNALEVLLLSENLLEDLAGLEACQGWLWKLDARGNRISDLSAFAAFEHIGVVDLGLNMLGYSELVKLAHVNIMSLRVDGNSQLVGGDDGSVELSEKAKRRRNLVYLLPLVWILDDIIVTSREREAANAYFAAAAENDTENPIVRNILALRKKVDAALCRGVQIPRVGSDTVSEQRTDSGSGEDSSGVAPDTATEIVADEASKKDPLLRCLQYLHGVPVR